ncbi:PAS domain-containing sensor histidine kinase [Algicola sagamiensis]|uniref:PAS domain-containing sensor histidine kinase n=1 Tax=Algicola sagamiensis TaxID=163869 RepID=UPI0003785609|nr:ATP-binding protein [Algicola sagamiensis]
MNWNPANSVLGTRLLKAILLFSSLITLIMTAVVLFADYRRDIAEVESGLDQIKASYSDSLSLGIWSYDTSQIDSILKGILNFPAVEYVTLISEEAEYKQGKIPDGKAFQVETFPLTKTRDGIQYKLGEVHVALNYEKIYDQLKSKGFYILGTQFLKTVIVSLFILFMVHQLITRHLVDLSKYAEVLGPENLSGRFSLKRNDSTKDELSTVVKSLDELRVRLSEDMQKRLEAETRLLESEARLNVALQAAELGLLEFKGMNEDPFMNSHFILQVQGNELDPLKQIAHGWFSKMDMNERVDLKQSIEDLKSGGVSRFTKDIRIENEDGSSTFFTVMAVSREVRGQEENNVLMAFLDISESIQIRNQINQINESLQRQVEDKSEQLTVSQKNLQMTLDRLSNTIDEMKGMQNKLVMNEKMAAVGKLVAGLAHEMNTPLGNCLTSISGVQTLVAQLQEVLASKSVKKSEMERIVKTVTEYTDISLANINRASELVRTFKELSTDDSGEDLGEFDITANIRDLVGTYQNTCRNKYIRIQLELPDELSVITFREPLNRVLSHLLENVIAHAFDKDTQMTRTGEEKRLTIGLSAISNHIRITVSDNGHGIPEDEEGSLFEAFHTTNRMQGGIGLGLYICYNLTTQVLKGQIDYKTKQGEGTTFTLEIPRELESSIAAEAEASS